MNPQRHAPVRANNKIFLAGRTVRIEWNTDDPPGNYLVLFANDGYLRLQEVATGVEFLTSPTNVWRITDVNERA